MALYETFMTPCTLMERTRVQDGEGGWTTQWVPGASFDAAIVLDSALNALIAEAQGVTGTYTVTAARDAGLGFHTAFARDSDGKTFRIVKVTDPTPAAASFQFSQYKAEEWELS